VKKMRNLIFLVWMHRCHCSIDKRSDGFIMKTLEVGSNGMLDIIWDVGYHKKITDRSKDGEQWPDIFELLRRIVILPYENVEPNRDKHYCIERMILE
jgi:hypothetical protein